MTMEIIERGPRGVLLELPMTTGQFVAFSGLDRDGRRYEAYHMFMMAKIYS